MLVYVLGRRAYGRTVGWLAALSLAVTFLHVRDSHFATLDVPLTFAVTVALYCAVRLAEVGTGRAGALAGATLGLAAGVKYNGALALAGIAAAVASPLRDQSTRVLRLVARRLVPIGLAAAAVFVLTSPFLLIDFALFRSSLAASLFFSSSSVTLM